MSDNTRRWLDTVKRQWWVVLLTVAVAASIPLVFMRGDYERATVFEGRATISVETKTLGEFTRLPIVDELLQDVQTEEFVTRSAKTVKVPAEELDARMRVYSVKSPQTGIVVAYRSGDATEARRVAEAMAKGIAARAQVIGKDDVAQLRRQMRILNDGIAELEDLTPADDPSVEAWKRADVSRSVWAMKLQREVMSDQLRRVQHAYSYRPPVAVRELPAIQRSATGVGGALLGGLAAGLAIASVREALWRRKRQGRAAE